MTRFTKEPYIFAEPLGTIREATIDAKSTHDGKRYHYLHTVHHENGNVETIDLRN